MKAEHRHEIKHWPSEGTGYGVCECGATIRVTHGKEVGEWHACPLCVYTPAGKPAPGQKCAKCGCQFDRIGHPVGVYDIDGQVCCAYCAGKEVKCPTWAETYKPCPQSARSV
jgi:hypothetical protein